MLLNLLGKSPPSQTRRRYFPSDKDIANLIYKSRCLTRLSNFELEQLRQSIAILRETRKNDKFNLKIEVNEISARRGCDETADETDSKETNDQPFDQSIIVSHQTMQQQRLLRKYGVIAVFTEVSRNVIGLPFPTYALFVPTNVDFQLVYTCILQNRTKTSITIALEVLLEWNPNCSPKYILVDFTGDQIDAMQSRFPSRLMLS